MRIILLDGSNLMHRARYGFGEGEHNIIYNFFRCLRPVIEKFAPEQAYFVLEGNPRDNRNLLPEYKANRVASPDDFRKQRVVIEETVKTLLPFVTLRHPHFECDDLLYSIVKKCDPSDDVTVISTDTDFIQLYDEFKNVTIWNPVKKKVTPGVGYDYVTWKALRGDKTDNIPGIPGVGDKKAADFVSNPDTLNARLLTDEKFRNQYELNRKLIKLDDVSGELDVIEIWNPEPNWNALRNDFNMIGFKSITEGDTWKRFVNTFRTLKPGRPSWMP